MTIIAAAQLAEVRAGLWSPLAEWLRESGDPTERLLLLRHVGEVLWIVAIAVAGTVAVFASPGEGDGWARRRRERLTTAVLLSLGGLVAFAVVRGWIGHRFRLALFSAFRVDLLLDDASILYAFPITWGFVGGLMALARPDGASRQLGLGLWLWMAAAFAPYTPVQALELVVAVFLVTRAAQAHDPEGRWRRRNPWRWLLRMGARSA